MKKIRVGLLTMSDGRIYIHNEYEALNFQKQHAIKAALEATGVFEVVEGEHVINSNTLAKREGTRLREGGGDGVQLHHLVLSPIHHGGTEFRPRPLSAVFQFAPVGVRHGGDAGGCRIAGSDRRVL